MASMRFLTEEQIQRIAREAMASEIADRANALVRAASHLGLVLEICNVADAFGVVTVRERDPYFMAKRVVVPA